MLLEKQSRKQTRSGGISREQEDTEKLLSIMDNPLHPLQLTLVRQRAPPPKGCFVVITTDKPSLYTITLSPLPDRENSDLSTVLLYILLSFIVYFALYVYIVYILLSIYVVYRVFFVNPLLL